MATTIDGMLELAAQGIDVRQRQVTQEFESVQAFAAHLLVAELRWRENRKSALRAVGKLLAADMRKQVGEYQEAHGEYPAWEPLAESTEDEKARLGAPPDAPLLRFGGLKKSFRSTVEGVDTVIAGSTDPTMDWHEWGTSKMPPRPVVGPALVKNHEKIERVLGIALLDAVVSGQRMGIRPQLEVGDDRVEDHTDAE